MPWLPEAHENLATTPRRDRGDLDRAANAIAEAIIKARA